DPGPTGADWLHRCGLDGEVARAGSWAAALELLRRERFDAVLASPSDPALLNRLGTLHQAERVLATLPDGVAVVDFDLRVRWANPTFEAWCGGAAVGRGFYEALGSPQLLGPDFCPFHTALTNLPPAGAPAAGPARPTSSVTARLQCRGGRYVDLHITPIYEPDNPHPVLVALGRDVSALVQRQQMLDALHKAGRELVGLAPEGVAGMSPAERVELLKHNIRRLTHDLLHYDVIEVRLLDPRTGRLEPLLQEGMAPDAADRPLLAAAEGQGVTGYVAATGRSHACPDTAADPLYLPGAPGARSSLTVPLRFQDRVVGTFNVESPRPNAFGEEDLQFAEIFGHEVAAALNTLELLSAEESSTATESIEAVNREVALPVDDILGAATAMLERYIGHDPEMANKIRQIIAGARLIKQSIQKVGETLAPAGPAAGDRPAPPPALKGLRVLVADSDERVRRSAHGLLGRWGCVVETARDGQEALTMARLGSYDAILADIRLPDVGGYDIYRGLREAQPQARVILMTGYGYDPGHAIVKARQDGLRHVLFKPFRVDQLLSALSGPAPGAARDGAAKDGPPVPSLSGGPRPTS
ncbi:MAG TPA: response regulator, partial [Gemmataceae bacterium]|nr:response regulator [Gemmataceae bacterium]